MPALSQQQQKLFGLALAVKRGEVPASEVSDEVKAIVDRMSEKDIEDFAGTKHAGLPKKVEQQIRELFREIMRERVISNLNEADPCWKGYQQIGMKTKDGKEVPNCVPESIQEGKKRFNTKYGVGKSKYVVNYHDGSKKHKDGSDFFDIQIFKNQKDLDTFKKALLQKGFIEESVNEDTKKRFEVDFYKVIGDRQTSHEEIIRGDKFSDVISQATKVAKSKGMNYVEFYYKDAFIGSIDKKSNYTFKKGRNSEKSPLPVNEAAGKEAMGIAAFTGTRGDAVQKFIDDNKLDAKKLFNYVKGGKLTDRLNFVTAIVGTPGNPVQKRMIKMFGESINEESYKFGKEEYTKKNLTPTQILDLAMAYANVSGKGTNMYGGKMESMIKVANDLAKLNGTKQMDAKSRGNQPALLLFLLKNQLVTKDEYVKLYKNLLEKQISVVKALKNADPASRMVGGAAARQAHRDMKGEFEESVNEEKYPIAIEKFNKELIKHPMVKKAAQHYKKTPAEIVKVLQQRLYTKGDKTGDTKEVWIDFKDTTSGITIKHKMKF